MSTVILAFAAI